MVNAGFPDGALIETLPVLVICIAPVAGSDAPLPPMFKYPFVPAEIQYKLPVPEFCAIAMAALPRAAPLIKIAFVAAAEALTVTCPVKVGADESTLLPAEPVDANQDDTPAVVETNTELFDAGTAAGSCNVQVPAAAAVLILTVPDVEPVSANCDDPAN